MSGSLAEPRLEADGEISLEAVVIELERELMVRRRCYPRWVNGGRLQPHIASVRMAAMVRAVEELRKLVQPKLPL